jgi:hypothetical protein
MPQHQHCPPEKRRGDKNPECHEEQRKDLSYYYNNIGKLDQLLSNGHEYSIILGHPGERLGRVFFD